MTKTDKSVTVIYLIGQGASLIGILIAIPNGLLGLLIVSMALFLVMYALFMIYSQRG